MLEIKNIKYRYKKRKKIIKHIFIKYIYFKKIRRIIQISKVRKAKFN